MMRGVVDVFNKFDDFSNPIRGGMTCSIRQVLHQLLLPKLRFDGINTTSNLLKPSGN